MDHPDKYATACHVMLDAGAVVTVGWDQISGRSDHRGTIRSLTGVISAFPLPADGLNNSANVDMSSEWPLFRQRCTVQGYEVQKVMADLPSLDEAVKKGWLQCDCCAAPMTRHRTAFFCPACGYLRLVSDP